MGADRVAEFLDEFDRLGWESEPFAKMPEFVSDPELRLLFVRGMLQRLKETATFFDAALSFLTLDEFAVVIDDAVQLMNDSPESRDEAAGSVIAYASLQCPQLLTRYLSKLWNLDPNSKTYYREHPWRGADSVEIARLVEIADSSDEAQEKLRACECLLEARSEESFAAALPRLRELKEAINEYHYRAVGMDLNGDELRPLRAPRLFHLIFSDSYLDEEITTASPGTTHPTWLGFGEPEARVQFGGTASSLCANCGEPLCRVLDLDPIPAGLGVTTRKSLEIVTCLSCVGWEKPELFFAHDLSGVATPIGIAERGTPNFPELPLPQTTVALSETPERWAYQDWALSSGRENLHRLGGEPTWIQSADYPACPTCQKSMMFLLQLDSELPAAEEGQTWLWGSGGIGYFFWCDACAITANTWQCT